MSAPSSPIGTPPPPVAPVSYAPPPVAAPPKKRKTWLIVLVIVLSLILLFIVGCCVLVYGVYRVGKSHMAVTPEGAVTALHLHMALNEEQAIYDETDPVYKQNESVAQSNAEWDRIHNLLGTPGNTQIMDTKHQTLDGKDVVDLVVLTTFSKGSANENIQFRKGDDSIYHMTSYGIESDNLR